MQKLLATKSFTTFGLTSVLALTCCSNNREINDNLTPNIIIIYIDDMGYGDLSLTGASGYITPNIDRMAAEGMFFTHFYAPQAVCSASRAGLLTGCYPNRIGITGALGPSSENGINTNELTIAEMLKEKGYNTAIFGKWHLGHHEQFLPNHHGFDEFYGIPYSNDMWPLHPQRPDAYPELPLYENLRIVNKAVSPDDQTRFTTIFTLKTTDFIRKNKNQPFFICLAHPMPHVPLYVSEKFKGKSEQGLYGDVMMEIDWSVGVIIQTLIQENLLNNTLLIFTSDNGPWINYGNHAGSTGGLREGKGGTFEGGQRVPCLMMWKGVIPEGKVCNQIASSIDIMTTLADITKSQLPKHKVDGVSLSPLMKGNFETPPRKIFYYYYRVNSLQAIRYEQWKLVFAHPGRSYEGFEPGKDGTPGQVNQDCKFQEGLYNLRRDPGERYNLMEFYPDIVEKLKDLAMEARNDLGDDIMGIAGKNQRPAGMTGQQ